MVDDYIDSDPHPTNNVNRQLTSNLDSDVVVVEEDDCGDDAGPSLDDFEPVGMSPFYYKKYFLCAKILSSSML